MFSLKENELFESQKEVLATNLSQEQSRQSHEQNYWSLTAHKAQ